MAFPWLQTQGSRFGDHPSVLEGSGKAALSLHGDEVYLGVNEGEYETLLRINGVKQITGLSRSYIYELSAKGLFPQSISLVPGGSAKAWIAREVHSWVQDRIKASRTIH